MEHCLLTREVLLQTEIKFFFFWSSLSIVLAALEHVIVRYGSMPYRFTATCTKRKHRAVVKKPLFNIHVKALSTATLRSVFADHLSCFREPMPGVPDGFVVDQKEDVDIFFPEL